MTDDRRFFPIGKGRLVFPDFRQIDEISLMQRRERTFNAKIETKPFQMAHLAAAFGANPIPHLVEHDPQKLLPSPQHFGREPWSFGDQVIHHIGSQLGLTYAEITDESYEEQEPTRWKRAVITVGDHLGDITRQIAAVSAMPNVIGIDIDIQPSSGYLPPHLFLPRWNEPGATPLEDIAAWREAAFGISNAFRSGVDDYVNHQMRTYVLGAMFDKPVAEPLAKQSHKPYLKHDPTKTHNRRRRRK